MAFLIDQLNNSGLFAQSAYSAGIATCDSDGNIITATYLTGVDLTPYQTTAGMTAYATTGDVSNKLDTSAFNIPESANWNNVYDTVNVYSGTWTGSESSPTASVDSHGSIDIVSSTNTVYFDVNGTWFNNAVNSAVDVAIDNVARLMGVDETVLFTSSWNDKLWNVNLSEPVSSFKKIRMYVTRGDGALEPKSYEYETDLLPTYITLEVDTVLTNDIFKYFTLCRLSGSTYTELSARLMNYTNKLGSWNNTNSWCHPIKIVGIGRKQ